MGHYSGFEALYPCGLCSRHFEAFGAFFQHEEDTGHWCNPSDYDTPDMSIDTRSAVDEQWFATPQAGEQHKDNVTNHEVYMPTIQCDSCERRFDTLEACYQHEDALGHGCKPFLCEICNRGFRFPDELDKHTEDHHPKTLKCDTCTSTYRTEGLRDDHMDAEDHYVKPFKCETCTKVHRTGALRDQHQADVGHYNDLHCAECNKYFKDVKRLRQHRRAKIHSGEAQSCPFCKVPFRSASLAARHIELARCTPELGLNREKVWQYYRECDPQGVFTEAPDSQYDSELGNTVLALIGKPLDGKSLNGKAVDGKALNGKASSATFAAAN